MLLVSSGNILESYIAVGLFRTRNLKLNDDNDNGDFDKQAAWQPLIRSLLKYHRSQPLARLAPPAQIDHHHLLHQDL